MMTKWGWFRIIILLTCIDNAGDDRGATAAATDDDNDDRSDRAPKIEWYIFHKRNYNDLVKLFIWPSSVRFHTPKTQPYYFWLGLLNQT